MLGKIGAALFCLGIATADSDLMIIPIGLVIVGAVLFRAGERRDER